VTGVRTVIIHGGAVPAQNSTPLGVSHPVTAGQTITQRLCRGREVIPDNERGEADNRQRRTKVTLEDRAVRMRLGVYGFSNNKIG
jgi:hypothetical protein